MIPLILILVLALLGLFFIGTFIQVAGAVLFGLIAGAVARFAMPGTQDMEWWQTALLGLAGSVVAGVIGAVLGIGNLGLLGSIAGAVLLLWLWGRMRLSGLICIAVACLGLSGCINLGIGPQRVADASSFRVYPFGESAENDGKSVIPQGALGLAAAWTF